MDNHRGSSRSVSLWRPPIAVRAVTLPLCFLQRRIQPTGFLAFSCSLHILSACWRSPCKGEAGFWDSALPSACKLVQVAVAVWAACLGHCWDHLMGVTVSAQRAKPSPVLPSFSAGKGRE